MSFNFGQIITLNLRQFLLLTFEIFPRGIIFLKKRFYVSPGHLLYSPVGIFGVYQNRKRLITLFTNEGTSFITDLFP